VQGAARAARIVPAGSVGVTAGLTRATIIPPTPGNQRSGRPPGQGSRQFHSRRIGEVPVGMEALLHKEFSHGGKALGAGLLTPPCVSALGAGLLTPPCVSALGAGLLTTAVKIFDRHNPLAEMRLWLFFPGFLRRGQENDLRRNSSGSGPPTRNPCFSRVFHNIEDVHGSGLLTPPCVSALGAGLLTPPCVTAWTYTPPGVFFPFLPPFPPGSRHGRRHPDYVCHPRIGVLRHHVWREDLRGHRAIAGRTTPSPTVGPSDPVHRSGAVPGLIVENPPGHIAPAHDMIDGARALDSQRPAHSSSGTPRERCVNRKPNLTTCTHS